MLNNTGGCCNIITFVAKIWDGWLQWRHNSITHVVRWCLLGTQPVSILHVVEHLISLANPRKMLVNYLGSSRARRFPLPDGPGQVKLPVGQVDLDRFFFFISYKQIAEFQNYWSREVMRKGEPCSSQKSCLKLLWPSDAIWCHKFLSTLVVKVMGLVPDGTKPITWPNVDTRWMISCGIHQRKIHLYNRKWPQY